MKTFTATVGKKSLEYMQFLLKLERDKIIPRKTKDAVTKMGDMAANIAKANVSSYPETSDLTGKLPKVKREAVVADGDGYKTSVVLSGENAVFIEFGAGQYYNTPVGSSPHPLGIEKGYEIGSYSKKTGKGNAFKDWWYLPAGVRTKSGKKITHGVRAWMPLHNAWVLTGKNRGEIARKAFEPPTERHGR